jgi:FAD/FMN-containing dehydrogenase
MSWIDELDDTIDGDVVTPGDRGYDEARTVFPGDVDHRPAAVVRVAGPADVQEAVRAAAREGMDLSVRSGGHSAAGHGVAEGGLVVDLRAMRGMVIDPDGRTAWADTGMTAAEYTTRAGELGLATGFGDMGTVGIGGITLGGGMGLLVRRYGLTIDDLVGAEVVTADGRLLQVDADHHPDLFWAIRGGGGNFGVATRFHLRLHPLETVVGGILALPATPEVIVGALMEADAAPEELSVIVNAMKAPPMPFLPPELHGRTVVMLMMVHTGPVDDGQAVVDRFRALASPLFDGVQPMRYADIYPPAEDYRPVAVGHSLFLDEIDLDGARAIVDRLEASVAPMAAAQIRVLGGAMGRVPVEATAFPHRRRRLLANVAAFHEGHDRDAQQAWVESVVESLDAGTNGGYVGFMADEGPDRVRAAYPGATWDRLREVKARYDPDNLFRHNQNIPPGLAAREIA